jgi:GAF domain-containing protein
MVPESSDVLEGPIGGPNSEKGDLNRDHSSIWEQTTPYTVMTPPGAINELPSIGFSSPALQNQSDDAPWSTSLERSSNYDWANFVYAYARGRWDPVRLPHPPNQSNVVPGATVQIGVQVDKVTRPATPEAPQSVIEVRRPSLTYTTFNANAASQGQHTIDPGLMLTEENYMMAPSSTSMEATVSHLDFEGRTESAVLGKYSNSKEKLPTVESLPLEEPSFVNPFSILQLASSSAPNMGKALTLGESAQRQLEEREEIRNSPSQGAKTDSEIISRESLSRRETEYTKLQDNGVWQSSSLFSPADRQAGVLPFVSPMTVPRPPLAAQMSELALSEQQSASESKQRPRPTPVQYLGANLRAENTHADTWASAPDPTQSASTSFSVSSHSHLTMRDESTTVSGLRRAARRTSIKRADGSRDMVRDITATMQHSKSFPTAAVATEAIIREVPSLDQIQPQHSSPEDAASETRLDEPVRSLSEGKLANPIKSANDGAPLAPPGRSRAGSYDPNSIKMPMPAPLSQTRQQTSNPNLTAYLNVGKHVERFYRDFGYLPSIIPPDEQNRRQALRRYGPPKMHGDTNFDRIGHLVKLVFNTKLVLISLVGEKSQFFQTEVGATASGFTSEWLQEIAQSRDCSLCSHAILQQTDEPLVILDAEKDWRFAGNPLVKGPPYIRFYAGSPLRTSDGYNLGSLCIIDDHPWTEFNPRQRHTLKEFSRVVMREMELSRDTIHLRIRDRMQHSIETFTRECLEMETSDAEDKGEESAGLHKVYAFAAKGMREALNASGAIVFDLSHFELVVSDSQSHDEDGGSKIFFPSPYQYPDVTPFADFENPDTIEGVNMATELSPNPLHDHAKLEEKSVPPMAVLGASELYTTPEDRDRPVPLSHYLKVAEFLRKHRTGHYFPFTPLPFRHLLPPGMTNILLVPIFGLNKQPFALLCAYSKPTETVATLEDIEEPGLQYLRAMGTIILSAILKKDIMLADKAKSHFISK